MVVMGSQTVIKQAAGLFTHPNKLHLPPGAMRRATNCVIDREGIVSKRRGWKRFGDTLADSATALFEYLKTLVQLVGSTLSYDSDGLGAWVAWSGTFNPPSTVVPMTSLEANGNFYFTTDAGVYVTDELTASPVRAGIPRGLDIQLALTGTGGSWLIGNSQVGVKVVFLRKDANENEKRGEPSFQEIATSPLNTGLAWSRVATTATVVHTAHGYTTGDVIDIQDSDDLTAITDGQKTITVTGPNAYTFSCLNAGALSGTLSDSKAYDLLETFTIPDEIVLGDQVEVYRTALSASEDDAPGDEHRLIIRRAITSGELAAGVVTLTDDFDSTFLKENLYTNQNTGEGSSQGNGRPPYSTCMATFKGHTYYGDYQLEPELAVQLLDVESLVDNTSSVTFTSGTTSLTYTFSSAENQGLNRFKRFTTAGEGTLAAAVRKTAKSLAKILNRDTTNSIIYAHYVSSATLDAPGKLLIVKRTVNTPAITMTANNSTTGQSFTPEVPTSGATLISTSRGLAHGLLRSKAQQPEAVPSLNIQKVGSQNKRILAIQTLPNAMIIYKEDGAFKLSGESDGFGGFNFVVDELDSTVHLLGRRNIGILNGAGVVFTTQGLMRVSPSGTSVISRAVEIDLLKIAKFSNLDTRSFLVPYESERKVILWFQEENADLTALVGWVWNYMTDTWTRWEKPVSCGIVIATGDDKLYLGHAEDAYILQERKQLLDTFDDYVDEDLAATVDVVGTTLDDEGLTVTQVTITFPQVIENGWLFSQGDDRARVTDVSSVADVYTLTLDGELPDVTTGDATLSIPIQMLVEWAPEDLGSSAALKHFTKAQLYLESGTGTHRLGFRADTETEFEYVEDFVLGAGEGWGDIEWGDSEWGGGDSAVSQDLLTVIPRAHQKCRNLSCVYENHQALENPNVLQVSLDVRVISSRAERAGSIR